MVQFLGQIPKQGNVCLYSAILRTAPRRQQGLPTDIGGKLNFPGNNFHFVLLSGDCSMDNSVFSVIHWLFSFSQSFLIIYLLFLFSILIFLW